MLSQVLRKRRPLDATLDACRGLDPRDAGFARAIASQTMRRLGQLEALIRGFVDRLPAPHRCGATFEILLAGACELLVLGVPAHAAVDGANRLAQSDSKAVHFKPLINAVLRRVARDGPAAFENQDAARLCTPDWLWSRWVETYGEDVAHAIAGAHLRQPPLDVVVRGTPPDGASHLFGQVWRLDAGHRLAEEEGFARGDYWVQNAAASLPVHLLGDVKDMQVLDLCAAPGGKTLQLASAGAQVISVERDGARLERLRENLQRHGLAATCLQADVRDLTIAPAPRVLLDAPCTATGTIRRHPELPWIKGAADVTLCRSAAAELLDCAAGLVAPGGLLLFAVCSLEPEEGPEQVADFLARDERFSRSALRAEEVFGHGEFIDANGDLRTLPCHLAGRGGMDGFYAARLRRRS